jgi:hypothetical protein
LSYRAINSLIIGAALILTAIIVAAVVVGPLSDDNGDDIAGTDATPTAPANGDEVATGDDDSTPAPDDSQDDTTTDEPTPAPESLQTISGTVTDSESDEPLSGVTVLAEFEEESTTVTTGEDGQFQLEDVPQDAVLSFSLEGYRTIEQPVDDQTDVTIAMQSAEVAGTVVDGEGQPIWDATIASGDALTWSEEDGSFRLDDAPDEGDIVFKAPGFAVNIVPMEEFTGEVTMESKSIRAIYATAGATADQERLTGLMDKIDRTELNSIVLDIKDSAGLVFYSTDVEMAHEIGAVAPTYDVHSVLEQLQERDIYTIARIVIFEDPILAEARPDLAIQDSQEGGIWRTFGGLPWVNPYREEVWNYNIELIEEAIELGFDEIQLDYMRFPSDGPLNRADYGQESTAETRDQAIADFLRAVYDVVAPTHAYLTGDIFGMTLWEPTEGGIGQNLVTVTEHLDYVLPMIYPSHFYEGAMGFDIPNNHPYEVIYQSLNHGAEMLPERLKPKIRPWLQDFSHGPGIEYGDAEVRAQIEAAEDFGASGWLLWNAAATYHEGALGPAE